jgi:hypothetical protein
LRRRGEPLADLGSPVVELLAGLGPCPVRSLARGLSGLSPSFPRLLRRSFCGALCNAASPCPRGPSRARGRLVCAQRNLLPNPKGRRAKPS